MEREKIYNNHSKRYLTKNGVQYKKLISQGFYVENNQLYAPKTKQSTFTTIVNNDVLENIIMEVSIVDLVSLYLTNKDIHNKLNTKAILNQLSLKYKVDKSINFSDFLTNYNLLSILPYLQYLYKLENNIEIPTIYFYNDLVSGKRNITVKMRELLIDWLMQFAFNKIHRCAVGLAVTLLDAYISKVNITADQLQLVGCSCMYISALLLNEDPLGINDLIYLADKAFNNEQITNQIMGLMNVLNGIMIRPSVMFYVSPLDNNMNNFARLSYFLKESIIYKPSLIYEAMHYMLHGTYKIYTLEEVNVVCNLLVKRINKGLKSSIVNIKKLAESLKDSIKYKCGKLTKSIKLSHFVYNNEWHINSKTPIKNIKTIGEGVYGSVKHIQVCNKDYAVKTSINQLDASITEIVILKNIINHPNIITLCNFDMVPENDKVDMYMPLMNDTLTNMVNKKTINKEKYPKYFKQIILGLHYFHSHDIIVRDVKDQNIVYNEKEDQFKLIDFGISVPYATFHRELIPDMASTLWYRAPEALLGDTLYRGEIDIWALGCVFVFMVNKQYLITGDDEAEQLYKIFQFFGTPTKQTWYGAMHLPGWKDNFPQYKPQNINNFVTKYVDIISACLTLNPQERATTQQLLDMLHNIYHV